MQHSDKIHRFGWHMKLAKFKSVDEKNFVFIDSHTGKDILYPYLVEERFMRGYVVNDRMTSIKEEYCPDCDKAYFGQNTISVFFKGFMFRGKLDRKIFDGDFSQFDEYVGREITLIYRMNTLKYILSRESYESILKDALITHDDLWFHFDNRTSSNYTIKKISKCCQQAKIQEMSSKEK